MTPEQRDLVMGRLLAAWPRPPLADQTLGVWHDHLGDLDYSKAFNAVKRLELSSRNRPTLSEFHAEYGPTPRTTSTTRPACGICDNGFVTLVEATIPTVDRCPEGCLPMNADERQAHNDRLNREWAAHRTRDREMAGARPSPLDFTEPGSRYDNEEPF